MTTKLTLTMDDSVINKAKKYALTKGKSLSGIIENYLISITASEEERAASAGAHKLKGVIRLSKDFDYKKYLSEELHRKYNK